MTAPQTSPPTVSRHRRVILRSAKEPWEVVSASLTLRRNVFRNNVGNLVFSQAAHRTLATSRTTVTSNRFQVTSAEAARINGQGDVYVLPLANAFRPSFRDALTRLTDFIEQLKVPVVVLGVGAQGTVKYDAARLDPISTEVKRFVGAVLDRSPSIGVRGAFTADYLAGLGFADGDVDVIGCPSMFMWGPTLPQTATPKALDESARISVGISPYRSAIGPFIARQLATYPDLTYLPQDIVTLSLMLRGVAGVAGNAESPYQLSHPLFSEDKTLFFVDPAPWMAYLATRDVYVGTRIHGTIMAVLAGLPGVLVTHDSRTRELAEYHAIPHVPIRKATGDVLAAELYESADFAAMHRTHPDRFSTYLDFLDRHRLDYVFRPGESPQEFDRMVDAARFPGPVHAPSRAKRYTQHVAQRTVAEPLRGVLRHFTAHGAGVSAD